MPIRPASLAELPVIVEIYNAAIPGRQATADTEPVTLESRREWFKAHDPVSRPLWVMDTGGEVLGWLSLSSFYGRPAYSATVEVSLYVATAAQRLGVGRQLLQHALSAAPDLGVTTLLAFIFAHNQASIKLFAGHGFTSWGLLPRVAQLDQRECDLRILGLRLAP